MTTTKNLLANGSSAKLVHITTEDIRTDMQRQHLAICGRKVIGYVKASDSAEVTCTKCARLAG